jgi:transposase
VAVVRGLLTDEEWAFFAPFVIESGPKRGRPPADHRRVLDAVFWIARTGSPWRDLPEELGRWASVYKQFLRWTRSGLWDVLLEALTESGVVPDSMQMVDSTIVRAHHCAAGAKGGLVDRVLGAREVASRPRSTSGRTRQVSPSVLS